MRTSIVRWAKLFQNSCHTTGLRLSNIMIINSIRPEVPGWICRRHALGGWKFIPLRDTVGGHAELKLGGKKSWKKGYWRYFTGVLFLRNISVSSRFERIHSEISGWSFVFCCFKCVGGMSIIFHCAGCSVKECSRRIRQGTPAGGILKIQELVFGISSQWWRTERCWGVSHKSDRAVPDHEAI